METVDSSCFYCSVVDKDFDALMAESKDDDQDDPNNEHVEEEEDWDERLSRDEVFSDKYRPSLAETREIGRLQERLGIQASGSRRGVLSVMGGKSRQKYTNDQTKDWVDVTQGSVLLKRGVCNAEFLDDEGDTTFPSKECQICLFTKGISFFTLSKDEPFLNSLGWGSVSRIIPNDHNDTIRLETSARISIVLEKAIANWKDSLTYCLLRYTERSETERTSNLGWQHLMIYTPGFSEAVSNDTVANKPFIVHDEYNQLTPLIYAVKLGHVQAAQSLLEDFEADPNQPDGEDGTVPLYWAESDEMKQLLLKFGAKDGQRHELFDNVDMAQTNVDLKRQQQRDAEAAQCEIQDNIKLLNERGQKIEQMGDRARELNDNAAEYRSLSSQLKSKMKQRSGRWGIF